MSDEQQFQAMPVDRQFNVLDSRPERPDAYDWAEGGEGNGEMPVEQTPHTMWTDPWEKYGAERMMDSTGMRQQVKKFKRDKNTEDDVIRASDVIASLNQLYPEMVPEPLCSDPEFYTFMKEFTESEDYEKLHRRTVYNTAISEIAAAQTMINYYQYIQEIEQEQQQNSGGGGEGQPDDQNGDGGGGGQQNEKQQQAAQKAAQQAVEQSIKSADEAKGIAGSLGIGSETGTGGEIDPDLLSELYEAYRNTPRLKKILQSAGQYLVLAKSMQRQHFSPEPEEIQDITISGAIEHLTPSEMAMLCHPDTEDQMIKKLMEKQAMAFQYASEGDRAAGPVMVFCDESGSMSGRDIVEAKAVSLVMAWIAIHQNRWCHLVGFASHYQVNEVTLNPSEPASKRSKKAIEWLNHYYGGGTDVDFLQEDAIEEMFERTGAPRGETDILFITDGQCHYSNYIEGFNRWKERNSVKMITIGIGTGNPPLPEMADHAHTCSELTTEDGSVHDAFSIGHRQSAQTV